MAIPKLGRPNSPAVVVNGSPGSLDVRALKVQAGYVLSGVGFVTPLEDHEDDHQPTALPPPPEVVVVPPPTLTDRLWAYLPGVRS